MRLSYRQFDEPIREWHMGRDGKQYESLTVGCVVCREDDGFVLLFPHVSYSGDGRGLSEWDLEARREMYAMRVADARAARAE